MKSEKLNSLCFGKAFTDSTHYIHVCVPNLIKSYNVIF